MANTTYDTIKSMKPAPWSKSTVADGNALNQNFLEPTHQKDLTLAAAIDQVKNTVDEYNEVINEINNIADAAQHQAQEAENSVNEMSDTLNEHGTAIENLDTNLNTVSAGLVAAAESIAALETNKQDKIYVDPTTIAGNGSHDNPYTVIGGGGGGGSNNVYVPNVDSEGNLKYDISATSASQAHVGPWNIKGPRGLGLSASESELIYSPGGTRVGIYQEGSDDPLFTFDVLNGQDGANGAEGFSPTITLTPVGQTGGHNNGGTQVEITFKDGESTTTTAYTAWNGNDGSMAGAPDIEGDDGVSALYNGSKYFVGISGGTYVPTLSAGSAVNAYSARFAEKYIWYDERTAVPTPTEGSLADLHDDVAELKWMETDFYSWPGGESWPRGEPFYADYAEGAYLGKDAQDNLITSAMKDIVDELHGKLDKSIWDSNSGKFLQTVSVNTTAFSGNGTSQNPLDLKINNPNSSKKYGYKPGTGWTEISEGGGGGSYTFDNTGDHATLSGDGSTNPIGVNTNEFYRKTETSGTSQLTAEFNTKTDYYPNTNDNTLKAQRLFVCVDDNDIIAHTSHADGKGSIFFRLG